MNRRARRRLGVSAWTVAAVGAAAVVLGVRQSAPDGTCVGACVAWTATGTALTFLAVVVLLLVGLGTLDD